MNISCRHEIWLAAYLAAITGTAGDAVPVEDANRNAVEAANLALGEFEEHWPSIYEGMSD